MSKIPSKLRKQISKAIDKINKMGLTTEGAVRELEKEIDKINKENAHTESVDESDEEDNIH